MATAEKLPVMSDIYTTDELETSFMNRSGLKAPAQEHDHAGPGTRFGYLGPNPQEP